MSAGEGFLGQLWIDLGVDVSGLTIGKVEFKRFAESAIASVQTVTTAVEKSAAAQITAEQRKANAIIASEERLLVNRIRAFDRFEAKLAAKLASEAKAAERSAAIALQRDALFDKLGLKEIARQEKLIAAQVAANQKILADATAASAASGGLAGTVASHVNRMSLAFTRFGQSFSMYVTAPILLLGVGAIKAVSDLDAIERKIVAFTSTTQDQMNAWVPEIKRISDETHQSSKSIAESFYFVANSALSAETTLKIVELSTKAAAAGMGTAADVGQVLTFVYNAYGESAFDAAKAMDILSIAIREGIIEVNQIVPVLGPILPYAAKVAVSFDQVASSIAIMTRTGSNAARSATAIRSFLQQLADASPAAQKALKSMGTSFEELRKVIREKGLVAALVQLDALFKKFGETSSGVVFKNMRSELAALGLTGPQMEAMIDVSNKAKTEVGAFARAYSVSMESVKFASDGAKVAFQNILLAIGGDGGGLIRFFNSLARQLNSVADWFRALTPVMQEHYIHMALVAAAIGPVVILAGNLIRVLGGLWTAVAFLFTPWSKLIAVFTFLTGPLGFAAVASGYMSLMALIGVTNPITAAAIAVGTLVTIFGSYYAMQKKVTEAQKLINSISEETATAGIRERIQIEQLVRVVKSHNTTQEQKLEAIKKINAISPENLGNIDEEAIKTGKATKIIEEYIATLGRKAKAQVIEAAMVDLEKQKIQDIMSGKFKEFPLTQDQEKETKAYIKNYEDKKAALQGMADKLTEVNALQQKVNATPTPALGAIPGAFNGPVETEEEKLARLNTATENQRLKDEYTKKLTDSTQKYADGLRKVSNLTKLFGDDVNYMGMSLKAPEENLKLLNAYLNEQLDLVGKVTPAIRKLAGEYLDMVANIRVNEITRLMPVGGTDKMTPNWTTSPVSSKNMLFNPSIGGSQAHPLKTETGGQGEMTRVTERYNKALERNNFMLQLNGKEYKKDIKDMQARQVYLEGMIGATNKITAETIGWRIELDNLNKILGKEQAFKKFLEGTSAALQGLSGTISAYSGLLSAQQAKEIAGVEKIAKQKGKSAAWVAKEEARINAEYGRKKKAAALAEAVVNIALGVASALSNPVTAPFVIPFILATGALQIATIQAQPMAEGGIVPPGYGNDTYPARLTSGEIVIPPGKLENIMGGGNRKTSVEFKPVVFKIGVHELTGILEEANVVNKSF